jgi:hypothetical protein
MVLGLLVIWVLCGVGAAVVASDRGKNGCLWLGLGLILGPIGWGLALMQGERCPQCDRKISSWVKVCPHCHCNLFGEPT